MSTLPECITSIIAELEAKAKAWDAAQPWEYDILLMEQFLEDECATAGYFSLNEDEIIDLKCIVAGKVFGWPVEWTSWQGKVVED